MLRDREILVLPAPFLSAAKSAVTPDGLRVNQSYKNSSAILRRPYQKSGDIILYCYTFLYPDRGGLSMLPSLHPVVAMTMSAVTSTLLVLSPISLTSAKSLGSEGASNPCPPLVTTCPYDISRPGWFAGIQVTQFARLPNPTDPSSLAPSPDRPDTNIYLVGNIGSTPFSAEQTIPSGEVVPAHDDVWPVYTATVYDGFGYWVVPGPTASTDTVRTRPQPPKSLVDAPLAYQLRIGQRWVNLNNAAIIVYGVQTGQLRLIELGFGGAGWFIFPQQRD